MTADQPSLGNLTDETGGVGSTAKRGAEFAANLVAASANRDLKTEVGAQAGDPGEAVAVLELVVSRAGALDRLQSSVILWADDKPQNNLFERQALEALGVRIVLNLSTEQALSTLESERFDLVLSDMVRVPDYSAGYTLLDALRATENLTPFVIYRGINTPEDDAEAKRRGALGSVSRPAELLRLVTQTLVESK